MAKVLVLGASGFIGTELVCQLEERGDDICAMVHHNKTDGAIDHVRADMTDPDSIEKALQGRTVDVVFHIASRPGDTGNPREMLDVNVIGLLNMLEWARTNPVKRYVVSSSISALEWYPATKFNPPDYVPVDEKHPARPKDMYASSKRMQELLAMTFYHQYEVPTTVLRLTAVVGPRGKGGGRGWREFAEKLQEGKKVQIPHFSPEELCHYVDIRDVARQHIVQAEHPGAVGEIFNCCATDPTRGTEFIEAVEDLAPGIEIECGFPWSMAQGSEISFDMSKAKQLLDYEPQYTLTDAVKSIKDWIDDGGLEKESNADLQFGDGVKKD